MSREIIHTANFVAEAAEFILHEARLALGERNEFRLALSGGNTPRSVYEALAVSGRDIPWDRVLVTFGDERCVPPDDPQSNFKMANEALFTPLGVPEKSILRLRGELDPRLAAQSYEDELALLATQRGEQIYRHDLLLLGLGDDGHTASLFPGTEALAEQAGKVAANFVPKFNTWRLTFTFPLINQARHIAFLVNKKDPDLIDRVLRGDTQLPAARVSPTCAGAKVTWLIG